MFFIVTSVPSESLAKFTDPDMPGPLKKNPNASLNCEHVHSRYSSEANM